MPLMPMASSGRVTWTRGTKWIPTPIRKQRAFGNLTLGMRAENNHATSHDIIQKWEGNIGFPPTLYFISIHLLSVSIPYQQLLCGITTLLPLPEKYILPFNIQIRQANSGKDREKGIGNQYLSFCFVKAKLLSYERWAFGSPFLNAPFSLKGIGLFLSILIWNSTRKERWECTASNSGFAIV